MGRTARPRRTSQAWDRDQPGHCFQVHDPAPEAAVADRADILSEPRGLQNHFGCLSTVDFFVVPTATFRLLFVFVVLHHERRRIVHFGVTAHPTSLAADPGRVSFGDHAAVSDPGSRRGAVLTARIHVRFIRLMLERSSSFHKSAVCMRLEAMGINEILTAPRSPWQNAYAETGHRNDPA